MHLEGGIHAKLEEDKGTYKISGYKKSMQEPKQSARRLTRL